MGPKGNKSSVQGQQWSERTCLFYSCTMGKHKKEKREEGGKVPKVQERVPCEVCGVMVLRKNLRRHRREVHAPPLIYTCQYPSCGYQSKRLEDIGRHELALHQPGGVAPSGKPLPRIPKIKVQLQNDKAGKNKVSPSATLSVPPRTPEESHQRVVVAEVHRDPSPVEALAPITASPEEPQEAATPMEVELEKEEITIEIQGPAPRPKESLRPTVRSVSGPHSQGRKRPAPEPTPPPSPRVEDTRKVVIPPLQEMLGQASKSRGPRMIPLHPKPGLQPRDPRSPQAQIPWAKPKPLGSTADMSSKLGCVNSLFETVEGRRELGQFAARKGYRLSLDAPTASTSATHLVVVAGLHLEVTIRMLGQAPKEDSGLQTELASNDALREVLRVALADSSVDEKDTQETAAATKPSTPEEKPVLAKDQEMDPPTPGTPTQDEHPEPTPTSSRQRASLKTDGQSEVESEVALEDQICLTDTESGMDSDVSLTLSSGSSSSSD